MKERGEKFLAGPVGERLEKSLSPPVWREILWQLRRLEELVGDERGGAVSPQMCLSFLWASYLSFTTSACRSEQPSSNPPSWPTPLVVNRNNVNKDFANGDWYRPIPEQVAEAKELNASVWEEKIPAPPETSITFLGLELGKTCDGDSQESTGSLDPTVYTVYRVENLGRMAKIFTTLNPGLLIVTGEEGLARALNNTCGVCPVSQEQLENPLIEVILPRKGVSYYEIQRVGLLNVFSLNNLLKKLEANPDGNIFYLAVVLDNEANTPEEEMRVVLITLRRYNVRTPIIFSEQTEKPADWPEERAYNPYQQAALRRGVLMAWERVERFIGPLPYPLIVKFNPYRNWFYGKDGEIYVPPYIPADLFNILLVVHETGHLLPDTLLPTLNYGGDGGPWGEGFAVYLQILVGREEFGLSPEDIFPGWNEAEEHYWEVDEEIRQQKARGLGFYEGSEPEKYERYLAAGIAIKMIEERYPGFLSYVMGRALEWAYVPGNTLPPTEEVFFEWVRDEFREEAVEYIKRFEVLWGW